MVRTCVFVCLFDAESNAATMCYYCNRVVYMSGPGKIQHPALSVEV